MDLVGGKKILNCLRGKRRLGADCSTTRVPIVLGASRLIGSAAPAMRPSKQLTVGASAIGGVSCAGFASATRGRPSV